MHKLIVLLLFSLIFFSAHACGEVVSKSSKNASVAKTKKCLYPKSKKGAPDWVCTSQTDKFVLAAVGTFAKSDAGLDFMEQMASTNARLELAKKLRLVVQNKMLDNDSTAHKTEKKMDSNLLTKITETRLEGTKVVKKAYGPKGRLYVLVGFDEAGALKIQNAIVADYRLRSGV